MSTDEASDPKSTSPDDLTKTTNRGSVQLTEEELSKASGGYKVKESEFLKIKLEDVLITGHK